LESLYPQVFIDRLTDKFLKNKRIVKIQNESFPILSNGNLILYLALHFFHHNFRGTFRLEFLHKIMVEEKKYLKDDHFIDIRQEHLRGVLWDAISKKY